MVLAEELMAEMLRIECKKDVASTFRFRNEMATLKKPLSKIIDIG